MHVSTFQMKKRWLLEFHLKWQCVSRKWKHKYQLKETEVEALTYDRNVQDCCGCHLWSVISYPEVDSSALLATKYTPDSSALFHGCCSDVCHFRFSAVKWSMVGLSYGGTFSHFRFLHLMKAYITGKCVYVINVGYWVCTKMFFHRLNSWRCTDLQKYDQCEMVDRWFTLTTSCTKIWKIACRIHILHRNVEVYTKTSYTQLQRCNKRWKCIQMRHQIQIKR